MNITGFANIMRIQQPGLSGTNNPLFAKPFHSAVGAKTEGALKQISQQMIDTFERTSEAASKKRIQEIELSEYTDVDNAPNLDDYDPELLEFFLSAYRYEKDTLARDRNDLIEFRDQLRTFDQTIQGYQDMLDGRTGLTDGWTRQSVEEELASTVEKRDEFLRCGAEKMNRLNYAGRLNADHFRWMGNFAFGKNRFNEIDASDLSLDASAGDIYSEIDKMLDAMDSTAGILDEGIRRIADALEKKGYVQYKYRLHMEAAQEGQGAVAVRKSRMTELLERIIGEEHREEIDSLKAYRSQDLFYA